MNLAPLLAVLLIVLVFGISWWIYKRRGEKLATEAEINQLCDRIRALRDHIGVAAIVTNGWVIGDTTRPVRIAVARDIELHMSFTTPKKNNLLVIEHEPDPEKDVTPVRYWMIRVAHVQTFFAERNVSRAERFM